MTGFVGAVLEVVKDGTIVLGGGGAVAGVVATVRGFVTSRGRLEPLSQGQGWTFQFQSGNVWRLKARLVYPRGGRHRPEVEIDEIKTMDFNRNQILKRTGVIIKLARFRNGITDEVFIDVPPGRREIQDRAVHTISVRGRLVTRFVGIRIKTGFDFVMKHGSAFSGDMYEAD